MGPPIEDNIYIRNQLKIADDYLKSPDINQRDRAAQREALRALQQLVKHLTKDQGSYSIKESGYSPDENEIRISYLPGPHRIQQDSLRCLVDKVSSVVGRILQLATVDLANQENEISPREEKQLLKIMDRVGTLVESTDSLIGEPWGHQDRVRAIETILTGLTQEHDQTQMLKQGILEIAHGKTGHYSPSSVEEVRQQFVGCAQHHESLLPILQNAELFSFHELKTGQYVGSSGSSTAVADRIHQLGTGTSCPARSIPSAKMLELFQARNFCLHNLEAAYTALCREIASGIDHRVCTKYFPSTTLWWVGTNQKGIDQQMIQIAKTLGITVLVHQKGPSFDPNKISFLSKSLCIFPQDCLEVGPSDIRLLAMPERGMPTEHQRWQNAYVRNETQSFGGVFSKKILL